MYRRFSVVINDNDRVRELHSNMMKHRIDHVPYSEMDQGRFYDEYMMKNKPVLLSKTPRPKDLGLDDWITDNGTLLLERLLAINGNNVVPVVRCDESSNYNSYNAENMSLKDYLCNECSTACYLKDWHFQW